MHSFRHIIHAVAIIFMLFSFMACDGNSYVRNQGMIWNTTYHITYRGPENLSDSILPALNEVSHSLSIFEKESLVNEVNARDTTSVDNHFKAVYLTSVKMHQASGGLFDPTLSPLITAWGFGPGHTVSADTTAIDSILATVGLKKTHLEGNTLIKDDIRTQFNFSAVAKGYGCDMVAEMLRRNGVDDFMVEIGGEIALGGKSPKGGDWKISIDRPVVTATEEIHDACAIIEVSDRGIATSGNYRNFHREGGRIFGHTVSPLTGRPTETDVISATVIAPTAMEADAAATACMASGSTSAIEMLKKLGLEGMLILGDSVWMSPGFNAITAEPGNKGRN